MGVQRGRATPRGGRVTQDILAEFNKFKKYFSDYLENNEITPELENLAIRVQKINLYDISARKKKIKQTS